MVCIEALKQALAAPINPRFICIKATNNILNGEKKKKSQDFIDSAFYLEGYTVVIICSCTHFFCRKLRLSINSSQADFNNGECNTFWLIIHEVNFTCEVLKK